jgi:hypothetical protein
MNAYSEDLRKKIVEALRRGAGKSEAARAFGVSLSSVKRYAPSSTTKAARSPRRSVPACNPRSAKTPSGCWRPTSESVPPPRLRRGAGSSGERPGSG